jgi:predicted amidohydrolase
VINFTPDEVESSEARVRQFKVNPFDGRQTTQNVGRLALLKCGMPDAAYSKARKDHMAYNQEHAGLRNAKRIALAAIDAARDQKADFLAMPEIFLPRGAVDEVKDAAEGAGLGLIAGIEYPEKHGGPVNEALVHVPGWYEPLRQRKQSPSREEVKSAVFETTMELAFVKRTTLGNLGVIVCSDLLELDVLWAMSSFNEKLDVVVVCSHNYHPEIFEPLAIADATRLHAFVAVVNTWTPRDKDTELPSGEGTLVAQPNFREPLLELEEHPLAVEWEDEIVRPSIAVAKLDIASIRERELEKPGAHGYISPPRFARL